MHKEDRFPYREAILFQSEAGFEGKKHGSKKNHFRLKMMDLLRKYPKTGRKQGKASEKALLLGQSVVH